MGTSDYYKQLKIKQDATAAEVHTAYVRLAVQLQPDKNPNDPENAALRLQRISTAYGVLSDPEKRLEYDKLKQERLAERGPEEIAEEDLGCEEVKELGQVIVTPPPPSVVANQQRSHSHHTRANGPVPVAAYVSIGSTSVGVVTSEGSTTARSEIRVRTVNNVTTTEVYENGVLVSLKRTREFSFT